MDRNDVAPIHWYVKILGGGFQWEEEVGGETDECRLAQ